MIGIDEVGRGALCGAVYLGFCELDETYPILSYEYDKNNTFWATNQGFAKIKDSKKLTALKRQKVVDLIKPNSIKCLTLFCSNQLIDQYGIGVCLSYLVAIGLSSWMQVSNDVIYSDQTNLGQSEFVQSPLDLSPLDLSELVIVDGQIKILVDYDTILLNRICLENNIKVPVISLLNYKIIRENRADDKYLSVALASNVAKVIRDSEMIKLDKLYPDFKWAQNKGYGTVVNRQAIKNNSSNPYIRKSFCKLIYPRINSSTG